jgi:hypothetical protein
MSAKAIMTIIAVQGGRVTKFPQHISHAKETIQTTIIGHVGHVTVNAVTKRISPRRSAKTALEGPRSDS